MDNTFGEKSRQNFRIEIENKNTIIKEITDFDLEQTLECGQCFRFYKQDEEDYVVVAFNKLLHIKQSGNQLIFFNTEKPDVENIWIPYFCLLYTSSMSKNTIFVSIHSSSFLIFI